MEKIVVEWCGNNDKIHTGVVIDTGYDPNDYTFKLLIKPFKGSYFIDMPIKDCKIIQKNPKNPSTYGELLDIEI